MPKNLIDLFQFEKEEDAAKAIREENGAEFLGKKIDVKVAKKRPVEEKRDEPPQQQHQPLIQQQSQYAGNNDGNSNWNKNTVNENRGFDNNRGSGGGFDNNRGSSGGFDNNRGGGGGFDSSSRGGGNWNSDRGGGGSVNSTNILKQFVYFVLNFLHKLNSIFLRW